MMGLLQFPLDEPENLASLTPVSESQKAPSAKSELFGGMSSGLAHDLQGLLTPVSTCLQLFAEGGPGRAKARGLLLMALRNLKTVQAYIEQARYFSLHARPRMQPERLDLLLQMAVSLAEFRWKSKRLAVVVSTPAGVTVELDAVFTLRLLGNLLANAIDAAPPDSTLRVELQGVGKSWLRVQVADQGPGISQKKLHALLGAEGDHQATSGLGLAICRKIVHWHHGRLSIESAERRGTTVTVDLPKRQPGKRGGGAR